MGIKMLECECSDQTCDTSMSVFCGKEKVILTLYEFGNGISIVLQKNNVNRLIKHLEDFNKKGGDHENGI